MHAAAATSGATSAKQKMMRRASAYNSSKQPIDLEKNNASEKVETSSTFDQVTNNHEKVTTPKHKNGVNHINMRPGKSRNDPQKRPTFNSSKQYMDLEELVEEEKEQKNWKGIGIAIVVIVVVLSCVSVAIIIVLPEEVIERKGDKLSLEELVNGVYDPYIIEPRWMIDGRNFLYKSRDDELVYFECDSNYSTVYLDSAPYRELGATDYLVSPDRSFILFRYESKQIYRHYKLSRYKVYNTDTRISSDLIGPHGHVFQYVRWAHFGQGLFAVQNNNIYFKESFAVLTPSFMQLTSSGLDGVVYNGIPDWLYGESVLQNDNTLWISPKDEYVVYLEINDTQVAEWSMTLFGNPTNKYSDIVKQKYPKQGTSYPSMKLKVYSFTSNKTITVRPPLHMAHRNHYLTSITWKNNISFAAVWLNHDQNISVISICTASSGYCFENLRLESPEGWIEPPQHIVFMPPNGAEYLIMASRPDGTGNSINHVAMVDATVDIKVYNILGRKVFITINVAEVVRIVGYFNRTVYFLGTALDDPKQRHLYSTIADKASPTFRHAHCVTCNISDECQYMDATFGDSGEYYVLSCLGPGVPYFSVYATPDILLSTLETNEQLNRSISDKLVPHAQFVNITLPDDDYILSKIILPPILDFEEEIRYNLIIIPNDNIGDQSVTDRFHIGWGHFLASFRSIIIAYVDTSGSRGRGDRWLKAVHNNAGARETEEILASMRYFRSLHYVNENVGVLGKEFGGHLSLSALSSGFNDVISCGAAISPVLDLSYIDVFTNEKYNRQEGYHIAKEPYLLSQTSNLKSHQLLVLHGTLDDRIHFQNSAQYVKALVAENIQHRFQVYPDIRNVFEDSRTRHHVISTIETFFINCFGIDPNSDPVYIEEEEEE